MGNLANILFKFGTKAQYDALLTKNEQTLYWLYDVLELRRGEELYGTGREATGMVSGLMSAEDKANLDRLVAAGTHVMTALDASIILDIDDENGVWKIGVALSGDPGNALTLKDDGLYVAEDMGEDVKYEIFTLPEGAVVDYREKEIRVMCPDDTQWQKQAVGANGDANKYYFALRAYAPEGAVSFKEDDQAIIEDETMYTFDHEFAGTDELGRKYSVVYLPAAIYDEASGAWTYYGANSGDRFIGWYYTVEWYDDNGVMISTDQIRINLTNEDCHNRIEPFYMVQYATNDKLDTEIARVSESITWSEL